RVLKARGARCPAATEHGEHAFEGVRLCAPAWSLTIRAAVRMDASPALARSPGESTAPTHEPNDGAGRGATTRSRGRRPSVTRSTPRPRPAALRVATRPARPGRTCPRRTRTPTLTVIARVQRFPPNGGANTTPPPRVLPPATSPTAPSALARSP